MNGLSVDNNLEHDIGHGRYPQRTNADYAKINRAKKKKMTVRQCAGQRGRMRVGVGGMLVPFL